MRRSSSLSPSGKPQNDMGLRSKGAAWPAVPFHDDKNPSMKLNEEYFYCFGCGATGDVIDLTARLYNLSPKEAAEKLAQDFGLIYDSQAPPRGTMFARKPRRRSFRRTGTMPFGFWRTTSIFSASGKRATHPKHRRNPCTPVF